MKEREIPLMLDNTIEAFDCCMSQPPKCDHCPIAYARGIYVTDCRIKMQNSVHYWLNRFDDME